MAVGMNLEENIMRNINFKLNVSSDLKVMAGKERLTGEID